MKKQQYDRIGKLFTLADMSIEEQCRKGELGRLGKLEALLKGSLLSKNKMEMFMEFFMDNSDYLDIDVDGYLLLDIDEDKSHKDSGYDTFVLGKDNTLRIDPGKLIGIEPESKTVNVLKGGVDMPKEPQHDIFEGMYEDLTEIFNDLLIELQKELMKEGYKDETELHNNKGTTDCKCKGTTEETRSTMHKCRGCCTGRGRWGNKRRQDRWS